MLRTLTIAICATILVCVTAGTAHAQGTIPAFASTDISVTVSRADLPIRMVTIRYADPAMIAYMFGGSVVGGGRGGSVGGGYGSNRGQSNGRGNSRSRH